ncbi:MAG TPA: hypothetical protein ACFE0H_04120 [Elainellaceae cyanobacterium]|jgi:hypothetical protein
MKQRRTTEVISFRLERQLVADLRKKALMERVDFSEYIRDMLFEALASHDIRADLAEMQVVIEEIASDVSELKSAIEAIQEYFTE